jgi:LysM repeat protein
LNNLARVRGWPEYKTFKYPPEHVHVVARGDSLYGIARHYETSVADIILANLGDEPIKLYSGTKLVIPKPGSGFAGQGAIPLDATLDS